jgi:hypothetical protein
VRNKWRAGAFLLAHCKLQVKMKAMDRPQDDGEQGKPEWTVCGFRFAGGCAANESRGHDGLRLAMRFDLLFPISLYPEKTMVIPNDPPPSFPIGGAPIPPQGHVPAPFDPGAVSEPKPMTVTLPVFVRVRVMASDDLEAECKAIELIQSIDGIHVDGKRICEFGAVMGPLVEP